MWHDGFMGMGWMWIWPVLILVFVIVAVVLVLRLAQSGSSGPGTGRESGETPLEILKKRYARGEISREEFEQMKRDLTGG